MDSDQQRLVYREFVELEIYATVSGISVHARAEGCGGIGE